VIFDPIIPESRIKAATEQGYWHNKTVIEYFDEAVAQCPENAAIVEYRTESNSSLTLSYLQLKQLVDRIALGLIKLGIEKGDVVSFQLPNWWQFSALHLACLRIGAVSNPLMPIFRHRELSYMLGYGESKLMVVPNEFRKFNYPKMLEELRPDLPKLEHVLVVGGDGENSFEKVLTEPRWEDEMDSETLFAERKLDPNDVIQMMYTSGTTGMPKGVMHTSNTHVCLDVMFNERTQLSPDDVIFMGSPLAHQTGFMYGIVSPILLKTKVVLLDAWSADTAWKLLRDEGVTFTMGATPFLADLVDSPLVSQCNSDTFKTFVCGGAPVPRVLVERAIELLKVNVLSAWGMTENGVVTTTRISDDEEKIFGTDGVAMTGMEVRVVNDDSQEMPTGEEGRLQSRGPSTFVGYLKRPEAYDVDEDGWFDTGDLAKMDEDGYIRISGRSKDIIIRGGENIPIVEVENVLYKHPSVQDVAIVAMPDIRMGELGCCFITLESGKLLSFEDMKDFLDGNGLAKQYWPERLEIIDEMPRTASGKIQKFNLREIAETYAK